MVVCGQMGLLCTPQYTERKFHPQNARFPVSREILEDLATPTWDLVVQPSLNLATDTTTPYCLSNMRLFITVLALFCLILRNNSLNPYLLQKQENKNQIKMVTCFFEHWRERRGYWKKVNGRQSLGELWRNNGMSSLNRSSGCPCPAGQNPDPCCYSLKSSQSLRP